MSDEKKVKITQSDLTQTRSETYVKKKELLDNVFGPGQSQQTPPAPKPPPKKQSGHGPRGQTAPVANNKGKGQ